MEIKKDPVRVFLGTVREARINVDRCMWKITQAESLCEQVTAHINGAPGGHGDPHKDAPWIELAEQREHLLEFYRTSLEQERAVDEFIGHLTNDLHRIILRLKYVDLLSWPRVQEKLMESGVYYSDRQIFRIHGEALQEARGLWNTMYPDEGETA